MISETFEKKRGGLIIKQTDHYSFIVLEKGIPFDKWIDIKLGKLTLPKFHQLLE